MQGNVEVRKRLGVSIRTADGMLGALMQLRTESDENWAELSKRLSAIGQLVCETKYELAMPSDWREVIMAFSKIRIQRAFAYLGDLAFRTELTTLNNFHEWRAQVKLMHEAIEQEKLFNKQCETWLERQKQWRIEHEHEHAQK